MKKIFLITTLFCAAPAWAQTTYICQLHGKAAYTTVKQDASCQVAQINGISEANHAVFAPPIAVASAVALPNESNGVSVAKIDANDPIAQIWYEHEYGSYDNTPILPPPPRPSVAHTPITPEKNHHTVQIASKPVHKIKSQPVRPSSHFVNYQAPSTPVLSRREILNQEIVREQTALKVAQTQLAIAQKRHDSANITKLNNIVRDRLDNVQSLQRELQR